MDLQKLAFSPKEVMRITGLGKNTVYQLLETKKLRGMRVGRRWLIPRRALDEFLQQ